MTWTSSALRRGSRARSWASTTPSQRRSISIHWRSGPMWPCNRSRSSSVVTRTCSAASSPSAMPNLLAALRHARELAGATPGTLETFLAVRGARTLALRLERAQQSAMILGRAPRAPSKRHADALSRPGEPPDSRGGAPPTQGLRHDHLVRRAWRRSRRRRRVRPTAAHPTRYQPGRGRVHHRTAGQRSRAGTPASDAAAAECGDRGRRGSLDRSGSSVTNHVRWNLVRRVWL